MLPNDAINEFLQSTCRFITTEERANDIKTELEDHILNYVEAYTNEGLTEDEATTKALRQMGDPKELGHLYKDLFSSKSRLIYSFFLGAFLLLFCIACIYDGIIEDTLWLRIPFALLITFSYGIYIILLLNTYRKTITLSKKEPLFYIQSYKKTTLDEWLSKGISYFCMFGFLLTTIACLIDLKEVSPSDYFTYFINVFTANFPLLIMCLLFTMFVSQNRNSVVYEEGLLTFMSFTPWENIHSYRWNKEYSHGKTYYQLQLKPNKTSFRHWLAGRHFVSGPIKVSECQMDLVAALLSAHDIPYMRHM